MGGLANTSCTRKMVCPESPIRLHQLLNSQTIYENPQAATKTTSPTFCNQTISKLPKQTNQNLTNHTMTLPPTETGQRFTSQNIKALRLGVPRIAHHEAEALTKSGLCWNGTPEAEVITWGNRYPYLFPVFFLLEVVLVKSMHKKRFMCWLTM